jgi:hypothetical protein
LQDAANKRVGTDAVRIPMMPKGVEHFGDSVEYSEGRDVRIPMMPKGVEH